MERMGRLAQIWERCVAEAVMRSSVMVTVDERVEVDSRGRPPRRGRWHDARLRSRAAPWTDRSISGVDGRAASASERGPCGPAAFASSAGTGAPSKHSTDGVAGASAGAVPAEAGFGLPEL